MFNLIVVVSDIMLTESRGESMLTVTLKWILESSGANKVDRRLYSELILIIHWLVFIDLPNTDF